MLKKFFCVLPPFPGCVRPYMVQNSWVNLTETNRGSFPVGTVLQYSCDPGYLPDGPNILTCTAVGRWSSEPPRCIRSGGKIFSPLLSFFMICKIALTLFFFFNFQFFSSFNYVALCCLIFFSQFF